MPNTKKKNYLNISERKILLRCIDFAAVILGLYFIDHNLEVNYITLENEKSSTWVVVFFAYFMLFGNIFELYNLKVSSSRYAVVQSVFLTTILTVFFYVFTPYVTPSLPENRIEVLYLFLGIVTPIVIWRFVYISFIFLPKFSKNILLVGGKNKIEEILKIIEKKAFQNTVVGYVSNEKLASKPNYKHLDIENVDLKSIVENEHVDEIVISTDSIDTKNYSQLNKQFIYLFEHGVNMKSIENMYEEITYCVAKGNLDKSFYRNISFSKNHENSFYLFFVRILDILIALFGLCVLIIAIPFVFLGNLIGSRGPLFYKQERVGAKGKLFHIYKFRSMVIDAEKDGAVWAAKNDTRITAFGKFLRKSRLDEVPQFWNILIGEMSLIGPRPERPEFVEDLKEQIPFYAIRHVIRPGLTGWAQVMFPYASTLEEQEIKLRYDLYYIKSRSLFLDFKVFIKTISTVLYFKGQ